MKLSKTLPFSLEKIVKDIGVNISKRKSTNPVLSFDLLNDINDWLAEENGENDENGDNLDEFCGEEEEMYSNPKWGVLRGRTVIWRTWDNVNRQQRYGPRKQLTRNRNAHSSLDENNYKQIVYINKDGVLEELFGYLDPKKDKNTKKIWRSLEHPVATGKQRKYDTISGRISCLAPNSRANNIEKNQRYFPFILW